MSTSPTKLVAHEEDDLFYFESDHVALKGNKDYSELLKTIFVLEAQRTQAVKDYETIVGLQKQALEDPKLFLEKLKGGESLGVPDLPIIPEIPNINWSKYKVSLPEDGLKFINSNASHRIENAKLDNHHKYRSNTHNKPWTTEEQKKLEELLVLYPPEPIEFRRFKKVAAALGNRTVKQVSSRVQKYFLKLYKAGLPIPGRIPKCAEKHKKSKLHYHQRHNHFFFKPTTFFPQLDIPVAMNEAEEAPGPSVGPYPESKAPANYLLPTLASADARIDPKNEIDLQLELLKKVKAEKLDENIFQATFKHFGFRCDYCDEEPIEGIRWHCHTCSPLSIDFCTDCVVAQMKSDTAHPFTHSLEAVRYDNMERRNVRMAVSTSSESENSDTSAKDYDSEADSSPASFSRNIYNTDNNDDDFEDEDDENSVKVNDVNGFHMETGDEMSASVEELDNNNECELNQQFTETQNVSYSYLHSHLAFD